MSDDAPILPSDVRAWRNGWLRPNGETWTAVDSHTVPHGTQWTAPSEPPSNLRVLALGALSLSSDYPAAFVDGGRIWLATREWGVLCGRELVGGSVDLARLPPPPLVVVVRPHPLGRTGLERSIQYVRDAIVAGRVDPLVSRWARQAIHAAGGLPQSQRGHPDPSEVVRIIFAAQKAVVAFVKDPQRAELMVAPRHLLCLEPGHCVGAGDCDDQLIVCGAALSSLGIPLRLVVRRYGGQAQGHIMLEYDSHPKTGGPWLCLDPSSELGTCPLVPHTEQITMDVVREDEPTAFVGLGEHPSHEVLRYGAADPYGVGELAGEGDGTVGAVAAVPAGTPQLPDDQAAGWLELLTNTQAALDQSSARLRANGLALAQVRSDLGLPATDTAPTNEALPAGTPALSAYIQTGAWTAEAQAAESQLLNTCDFVSQCLADGIAGKRALYFWQGDLLVESQPGDPYRLLMAPNAQGARVPTYFDAASGAVEGTVGILPILVFGIVAVVSLAVAYVVGKICDEVANTHHDDAVNKISQQQASLVASGQQTPQQAQQMVQALDHFGAATAPPAQSGLLDTLSKALPIAAILSTGVVGALAGFAISHLWEGIVGAFKGHGGSAKASAPRHVYRLVADGHVITHLGKRTFSKTEAEQMALDLEDRGYTVTIEPYIATAYAPRRRRAA
jgi:hypothetical protein